MRILQVATLVTPDGAYGGPIRVAINQTRALLEAGHDVTFAAGATGFGKSLPETYDGVPVKLFHAHKVFPKMGFSSLYSPKMLRYLARELPNFDVLHLHLGRDLVTLPASVLARRKNVPYIIQTHGMVVRSDHFLARPLDALWTKKALEQARSVLHLSQIERRNTEYVTPYIDHFEELHNGVPTQNFLSRQEKAQIEVLFMARLHAVKRPEDFVRMAIKLHPLFPDIRFRLVGPDEGEGKKIQKMIDESKMEESLVWEGALNPGDTLERMSRASIYVLPSEYDQFPMSVLEAMSLGIPVVVTHGCGLAQHVASSHSGAVTNASVDGLVGAITPMLTDRQYSDSLGMNARRAAVETFSMTAVAERLVTLYERAAGRDNTIIK